MGDLHVARAWVGTDIEDACPCPQAPCGHVTLSTVDPGCPEHGMSAAKTIRSSHPAKGCRVVAGDKVRAR
jgi:hypothetical protein